MMQFVINSMVSFAVGVGSQAALASEKPYRWQIVAGTGSGCFAPNCREGQFGMAIKPIEAFDRKLYIIGERDLWTSDDGVGWRVTRKTDWGARHGMQFAYFRGRLWMMGGMRSWDDFRNDVWMSENGTEWKQTLANAPWEKRRGHRVVVFKDKLWLIGGALSSGRKDRTPTEFPNDVWSSEDGVNWRLESKSTPISFESGVSVLVFRERLYAISGAGTIWTSANGKEWRQMPHDMPKGSGGSGVLVFDNKIWVLGGIDRQDVWSSADGARWRLEFVAAPWSKRNTEYSVVYKDKLFLFSGKTGREDSWDGAIWALSTRGGS